MSTKALTYDPADANVRYFRKNADGTTTLLSTTQLLTALGVTTPGGNILVVTTPAEASYLRLNADGTVIKRTTVQVTEDIGALTEPPSDGGLWGRVNGVWVPARPADGFAFRVDGSEMYSSSWELTYDSSSQAVEYGGRVWFTDPEDLTSVSITSGTTNIDFINAAYCPRITLLRAENSALNGIYLRNPHLIYLYLNGCNLKALDASEVHPGGIIQAVNNPLTELRIPANYNGVDGPATDACINVYGCQLSTNALNAMMSRLAEPYPGNFIDISNNPGTATCDPSIATDLGWTVYTGL